MRRGDDQAESAAIREVFERMWNGDPRLTTNGKINPKNLAIEASALLPEHTTLNRHVFYEASGKPGKHQSLWEELKTRLDVTDSEPPFTRKQTDRIAKLERDNRALNARINDLQELNQRLAANLIIAESITRSIQPVKKESPPGGRDHSAGAVTALAAKRGRLVR